MPLLIWGIESSIFTQGTPANPDRFAANHGPASMAAGTATHYRIFNEEIHEEL